MGASAYIVFSTYIRVHIRAYNHTHDGHEISDDSPAATPASAYIVLSTYIHVHTYVHTTTHMFCIDRVELGAADSESAQGAVEAGFRDAPLIVCRLY